jgi:hypothetical protein
MRRWHKPLNVETRRPLLLTLVVLTLALDGCGSRSTPPGPDVASGTFEGRSYVFMRWQEGLRLMIWHDIIDSVVSEGSGATDDPVYTYRGYATASDGAGFDWEVRTADGQTAQFMIDGTIYDLSEGRLFIVTTQGGVTRVSQLQRDLSGVQPNYDSIAAFAREDPDVSRFIERAENGQ